MPNESCYVEVCGIRRLQKRRRLTLLVGILLLVSGPVRPQATAPSTMQGAQLQEQPGISGRVLAGSSSQGVSEAIVRLTPLGQQPAFNETVTDETGHYGFKDLRPGPYELSVSKQGYGAYSQLSPLKGNSAIRRRIVVGQGVSPIADLRLQLGGVITGRVVDRDTGEPVPMANVMLLIREYRGERTELRAVGPSVKTNDRGEYRLFDVSEGRYTILASDQPPILFGALRATTAAPKRLVLVPTYYPGVESSDQAFSVRVRPGVEANADIVARRAPGVQIVGRISGVKAAQSTPIVTAARMTGGDLSPADVFTTAADRQGGFVFNLLSGQDYQITARAKDEAGKLTVATTTVGSPTSPDDRIVKIDLALSLAGDVQGTLVAEKDSDFKIGAASKLTVRLIRIGLVDPMNSDSYSASVDPNGRFVVRSVAPGKYYIVIADLPSAFVTSITYNGVDSPPFVTISSGGHLDARVSTRGAGLNVVVQDHEGKRVPFSYVILTSDTSYTWRLGFPCDQDGQLRQAFPPWKYRIFAFETMDDSLDTAELTKLYSSFSEEVDLRDVTSKTMTVTRIDPGQE
jgi:hypothetical protein